MSRCARTRCAALALAVAALAACLALTILTRAHGYPVPGGTVPSTLALSIGEPSPFTRVGKTRDGRNVYVSTLRTEVTATDVPTRLSLGDAKVPLRTWREPVNLIPVKVRLRRVARNRRALRSSQVLVTLTAGGP